MALSITYKFSGHETFPCRYAWLPKTATTVTSNPAIFSDIDEAMVEFGVGKNMVRSMRFWAEASDIIRSTQIGHEVTEFGQELLVGDDACDPYLEDVRTLWLLHWKLATNSSSLIFAWDYLLNHFHEPELYTSAVVRAFTKTLKQISDKTVSDGALEQLFEVFLHSYVPTRGRKGMIKEDNLDCPLVELGLLQHTGMARSIIHEGRFEPKYAFRREDKPEVTSSLFAYCLNEFWNARYPQEQSIPFHIIVAGEGSPGQIFKIPEPDIRSRLLGIEETTAGHFLFEESAAIPRVVKQNNNKSLLTLINIYSSGFVYA